MDCAIRKILKAVIVVQVIMMASFVAEAQDNTITVKGEIDARDLIRYAAMEDVQTLDLSAADISEFQALKPVLFNSSCFEANEIPDYVFAGCKINKIILPKSVKRIGDCAFAGAESTIVTVPDGSCLESIGAYAFKDAAKLKTFIAPISLKEIGEKCFAGCRALTTLSLPGVTKIGTEAFAGSGITSLGLPMLSEAADYALANMPRLRETGNVADAEGFLFGNPILVEIQDLPDHVPAYYLANSPNAYFSDKLEGTTSIGDGAFAGSARMWITLSPSLQKLGDYVFSAMSGLEFIDARGMGSTIPQTTDMSFEGIEPASIELCVPKAYVQDWRNAPGWSGFKITTTPQSSLGEIEAEDMPQITIETSNIVISSEAEITRTSVYTIDGTILYDNDMHEFSLIIPINGNMQGKVLIVTITTATGQYASRIIL